jgi:regulator of cell morphogenesis and NO signaling
VHCSPSCGPDLDAHLRKEEQVLLPAIRALVEDGRRDFPFGSVANPIRMMTVEHDRAGECSPNCVT